MTITGDAGDLENLTARYSSYDEVPSMRATTQARRPEESSEPPLEADERERTLRVLDALLEGDAAEQQETLAFLKEALRSGIRAADA